LFDELLAGGVASKVSSWLVAIGTQCEVLSEEFLSSRWGFEVIDIDLLRLEIDRLVNSVVEKDHYWKKCYPCESK